MFDCYFYSDLFKQHRIQNCSILKRRGWDPDMYFERVLRQDLKTGYVGLKETFEMKTETYGSKWQTEFTTTRRKPRMMLQLVSYSIIVCINNIYSIEIYRNVQIADETVDSSVREMSNIIKAYITRKKVFYNRPRLLCIEQKKRMGKFCPQWYCEKFYLDNLKSTRVTLNDKTPHGQ